MHVVVSEAAEAVLLTYFFENEVFSADSAIVGRAVGAGEPDHPFLFAVVALFLEEFPAVNALVLLSRIVFGPEAATTSLAEEPICLNIYYRGYLDARVVRSGYRFFACDRDRVYQLVHH